MNIPPRMRSHQVKRRENDESEDDQQIIIDHPEFMFDPNAPGANVDQIDDEDLDDNNGEVQTLATREETVPASLDNTSESLPILEAFQHFLDEGFQEFLEKERRRMRNRMIAFSAFFIVLLCGLVAGGLFLGMKLFNPIKSDVSGMKTSVNAYKKETIKNRKATVSVLKHFSKDIKKDKKSVGELREDMRKYVSNYNGDLKMIIALTEDLKKRNMTLQNELDTMKQLWPTMSGNIDSIMQEMASAQKPTPIYTAEDNMDIIEYESLYLSLIPTGQSEEIMLRLPLP